MSEEASGGGEKVFDPTPQKLEQARKKGDIPKSADVTAAATYIAFLAVLLTGGAFAVNKAATVMMVFIAQPDRLMGRILGPGGPQLTLEVMRESLIALAPIFVVPIGAVIASIVGQQAITFSTDKLTPKASKISIISNFKQKFGPTGLVEFLKSFVKLLTIATALTIYLSRNLDKMIGASMADPRIIGVLMMDLLVLMLSVICVISVSIASVDIVWQRFDHARKLRMSLQEIKDEVKQSEGDPHIKQQRRARAEEIATNRMMLDVPTADVVIVNPTHYAVALKWSRSKGSAPICVAKGEDEIARKIRDIATKADIPIHSDPPTARALNATVPIGAEIRPEHYRAVAAAIRFADSMRTMAKGRVT